MVVAGRRSRGGLAGAADAILSLTDTARGNLEPAYYWWHLTNMEQWLITKQDPMRAFDGRMVSTNRLLLKWHRGFFLFFFLLKGQRERARPYCLSSYHTYFFCCCCSVQGQKETHLPVSLFGMREEHLSVCLYWNLFLDFNQCRTNTLICLIRLRKCVGAYYFFMQDVLRVACVNFKERFFVLFFYPSTVMNRFFWIHTWHNSANVALKDISGM